MKAKSRLDSYITIPRQIASDWRNGLISKAERNLLIWLRVEGNPYGIVKVDMDSLAKEAFNDIVSKAYINRLLLDLKRKRYIHYKERKGRRGSFEVKLGDWITPNGISQIEDDSSQKLERTDEQTQTRSREEGVTEMATVGKRLSFDEMIGRQSSFVASGDELNRGSDNDTDNNNDNDFQSYSNKSDVLVTDYEVNDEISDSLKRIAESVGETSMGFILGIYKKYGDKGMWAMEKMISDLADYPSPRKRGAVFNNGVHRLLGLK